jgi:hypothetical protein
MRVIFGLMTVFALSSSLSGQAPDDMKDNKDVPLYYLDSALTTKTDLGKVDPSDVANIFVYKGKKALEIQGNTEKKNHVVFIETKKFARKRYWHYFKTKSEEYGKVVPSPESDKLVQYVLNGRILKADFEGELSTINDKDFLSIEVIPKDSLLKRYGIYRKSIGVILTTNRPVNLAPGKSPAMNN